MITNKNLQINSVKIKNNVIELIRNSGLNEIAERLSYLDNLPINDSLDKPLTLESLQGFAIFILNSEKMPKTRLSASPNGFLNAEWDAGADSLSMEFLDENEIRFAAIFYSGLSRQHMSGKVSIDNMNRINKSLLEYFL